MITFKKLLERAKSERIVVHTPTEEQAKELLKALDEKGYEWNNGDKLTAKTLHEDYKEKTCYVFPRYYSYRNLLDKKVMYDSLRFHQEVGYTIIEFSEIDFKEE